MPASSFTIQHVQVKTEKKFAEVTMRFEDQLGRFDPSVFESLRFDGKDAEAARTRFAAMAGKSGLMLFGATDHGKLLSTFGAEKKAVQYVVGNPLIAIQMTEHNLAAGLYAPLRVLIYEDEPGRTWLEYDLPSSLFGQFGNGAITSVALALDRKLDELVARALA